LRLLWVKAGGLVPPDVGGKIRSYNILKELAKRHYAKATELGAEPDSSLERLLR